MKRSDIDVILTDRVSDFLRQGYHINTISMCGHQGEEGKIDLVKGDKLVRIWLDSKSARRSKDEYPGYSIVMRVGTWKYPAKNIQCSLDTAWMGDFLVSEETIYYKAIHGDWYYQDIEEARSYYQLHFERVNRNPQYSYESQVDITNPISVRVAHEYLRSAVGYRRVSDSSIKVYKSRTRRSDKYHYIIEYRGIRYTLG